MDRWLLPPYKLYEDSGRFVVNLTLSTADITTICTVVLEFFKYSIVCEIFFNGKEIHIS